MQAAVARVEQVPEPCGDKLCLWERPVIVAPPGWMRDDATGARLLVSMYRPNTAAYAQSPGVFYAKAIALRGTPFDAFVRADLDRALATQLSLSALPLPDLEDGDHAKLKTFRLAARERAEGSVETLAYLEEAGYAVVFVLSARGLHEHDALRPLFESWVATYRRAGIDATVPSPDAATNAR